MTLPVSPCRAPPTRRFSSGRSQIGLEGYAPEANPVVFWDLYGKAGHPVRTTVSEIGPTLLGRILELNDVQVGTLEVAFKLADDRGLLLLDLDDLRALLTFVADNRKEVSYAATGSSARSRSPRFSARCCRSSAKAAEQLFGEPALELHRSAADRSERAAASSTSSPPIS